MKILVRIVKNYIFDIFEQISNIHKKIPSLCILLILLRIRRCFQRDVFPGRKWEVFTHLPLRVHISLFAVFNSFSLPDTWREERESARGKVQKDPSSFSSVCSVNHFFLLFSSRISVCILTSHEGIINDSPPSAVVHLSTSKMVLRSFNPIFIYSCHSFNLLNSFSSW